MDASPKLKALGHPVRLGIALRLAAEGGTCACDFAEIFSISQPAVSQHLKVLREAGLVQTRRDGTQIYYSLDPAACASAGRGRAARGLMFRSTRSSISNRGRSTCPRCAGSFLRSERTATRSGLLRRWCRSSYGHTEPVSDTKGQTPSAS